MMRTSGRDTNRLSSAWAPILALLLAPLVGLAEVSRATSDIRWHFRTATHRALVRLRTKGNRAPVARPVRLRPNLPSSFARNAELRAWDIRGLTEVPVQLSGKNLLLDPARPLTPGEERQYFLYILPGPSHPKPAAEINPSWQIETERYSARVNSRKGGAITSLILKEGERKIETLGNGIHWWVGRDPKTTQESFGQLPIQISARGPVFTELEFSTPDLLAKGNRLTTTYRFFKDFIEIGHHYHAANKAQLLWLKMPVSLRATGQVPGFFSNSQMLNAPMQTTGKANRWYPDLQWHDVSYLGENPFGIGVIARDLRGGLFYMDSVRSKEFEWIYAEPFGWQKPHEITSDFNVNFSVVPHKAGKDRYLDTLAKIGGRAGASVSAFQTRGGPPIDSDRDGLPDLAEIARKTNPNARDTDLDGIPDAQDGDPLRGAPPARTLALPVFKPAPTKSKQTLAQVIPVGGVPTLVLDGKPYGPMVYTRCAGTWDQIGQIADRNFSVYFEIVGSIGWPGNQFATFRRLDDHLNRFLDRVPDARIILRLYVCNPPHFARSYPDQVLAFNDGATGHFSKWYAMKDRPLEERGYPSFASPVWRRMTADALFQYVTHVRQSDYASHVIGYFICGGGTEEWYYWGDYDHNRYCVDFSKPMLAEFRDYLRAKYSGDVTRLRKAWQDPAADFATAQPPGPMERRKTDFGLFFDPRKSQRVRDYYFVHNKAMEDSLLIFARAVKQACNRQQIVGMFHGYLQNHWLLEGGQATLKDLLASPDVDFWSGPPTYNRRGPGEHGCNRFLMASLRKHGKLWISESDIRTSFSRAQPSNPTLYGRPPDLPESLACLKREFAHQLCEGANGWWFQMGLNWYHHTPILELFEKMQLGGEAAMHFPRSSDTDIAAVVDLESLFAAPAWPVNSSLIDAFKIQELCRIGSPVDFYELDDILAPDAKPYRLYLMLNCFSLTDRERKQIDERLRRRGAFLVWMFAPGLFEPGRDPELSLDHVRELLGFQLDSETGPPMTVEMKLTTAGANFFNGFPPDRIFGSLERPEWLPDPKTSKIGSRKPKQTRLRQRFFGARGGKVLARFMDGQRPSIVMNKAADHTDVWIGSVMAPADLLRSLARRARCHLFRNADEIIYANHSFLAIHTRAPGTRTFHLKRSASVIEVFSGRILAENALQFSDSIPAYRTRLYFLGNRKEWESAQEQARHFFQKHQQKLETGRKARAAMDRAPATPPAAQLSSRGPFEPDKDGLVTTFLFCGPFPSKGSGRNASGFQHDFIGEEKSKPGPDAEFISLFEAPARSPQANLWFAGNAGRKTLKLHWTPWKVSNPLPYLGEQFPAIFTDQSIAYYVAAYVESGTERPAELRIGSDDGFKLWLNGRFLGGENVSRSLGIDSNRFPVTFRPGRNAVLLKIIQGGGPTGWSLRLTHPDGKPFRQCKVWLEK